MKKLKNKARELIRSWKSLLKNSFLILYIGSCTVIPTSDEPEKFFHHDNVTVVLSDIIDENIAMVDKMDSIDMKLDTLEAKAILYKRKQEDEILRKEIIRDAIHIQEEIESIILVKDSSNTKKIDSIFSIVKDTIISKQDTIIRSKPIYIKYYTFLTPRIYVYRKNVKNRYMSAVYKNYKFYRIHVLQDSVIKIEAEPGHLTSHDIAKYNAMTGKEVKELKKIIKEIDPKLLKNN